MKVGGIVVCGGHSSRMGRAKAWLPFGDELMLPRIVRILAEAAQPIVVAAGREQELPTLPAGTQVVHDAEPGQGPLHGLATGLASLPGHVDVAFACSCDAPFLCSAIVSRLKDLLGEQRICVPRVSGHYHPLPALYQMDVLPTVRQLLSTGERRLGRLIEVLPTRVVEAEELTDLDPTLGSLRNLNTPEEYESALRDWFQLGRTSF